MNILLRTFALLTLLSSVAVEGQTPGSLDSSFSPAIENFPYGTVVQQPDGKLLVMTRLITTITIQRLHPNGLKDVSFTPAQVVGSSVSNLAVQSDGKIVVAGDFGLVNGVVRGSLARLNPDGTLESDATFKIGTGVFPAIFAVALQEDGKIVVGGNFGRFNEVISPKIVRLNPDGTRDTSFSPDLPNPMATFTGIESLAIQPDGKILFGGTFQSPLDQTYPRNGIARLNPNGSLESVNTFAIGTGATSGNGSPGNVSRILIRPDGKILIFGAFSLFNGTPRTNIAVLNPNGTLDDKTFNPNDISFIQGIQADGKFLLAGSFTTINGVPRKGVARLNPDGSLDSFDIGSQLNTQVRGLAPQSDGKLVVNAGGTADFPPTIIPILVRFHNDPAVRELSVLDRSKVQWIRGGSAPETSRVTFELSIDEGASWNPVGAGTLAAGGWQLTGLTLPSKGLLRARGRVINYFSESISKGITASWDQQVVAFNFTEAPVLATPFTNSKVGKSIAIAFTLPEAALPGSVTLAFGSTMFRLAASQESAGPHSFTFDAANPTASSAVASVTGGAIADGSYDVTLAYQDAAGSPAAQVSSANVIVDTTPPSGGTLELTPNPAPTEMQVVALAAGWTDLNGGLTYQFFLDETPIGSVQAAASISLNGLLHGTHSVKVQVFDALGNFAESAPQSLVVALANPAYTSLFAKDGPVPGAETDPRIGTEAVFTTLYAPAVNSTGTVAFLAKWHSTSVRSTGIFAGDQLLVAVGDAVPGIVGATFRSFRAPVIDDAGHVAFIAAITNAQTSGTVVSSSNDSVVVSNGRTGVFEVLAREGSPAPGEADATFRSFSSVSIASKHVVSASIADDPTSNGDAPIQTQSGTAFTAGLNASTAISKANDTGAWWLPAGESSLQALVREGASLPDGLGKVKSFQVLRSTSGSPAQGRGLIDGDTALIQVASDSGGLQAQMRVKPGTQTIVAASGDTLGGASLPNAVWAKMNLPGTGDLGSFVSVYGTLRKNVGETGAAYKGIFASKDSGASWEPIARATDSAPGFGIGEVFSSFKNPVNSTTDAGVAFCANVTGGAVTSANNSGIWWKPDGGTLRLLAREGGEAPQSAGAKWKSFSSLALRGGTSGPLFLAKLLAGSGTGTDLVTSANDLVLQGVDSFGGVRTLLRQSAPLLGKTVRDFNVLSAASGSAGSTRSFNANAEVVALVSFTDRTTAIVKITVP